MAIAIDSSLSWKGPASELSTWSTSFTNTAGTFLVVGFSEFRNRSITSVKYGGVAMTAAVSLTTPYTTRLYYLDSPATGSNTLEIIFGSTTAGPVGFLSLTGVDTADPIGATNTATGTSTTPSVTVTTDTDNSLVIDHIYYNHSSIGTATVGADQTEVYSDVDNRFGTEGGAMSYESKASAGATTMSWTAGTSAQWTTVGVEIHEATAAASTFIPKVTFF